MLDGLETAASIVLAFAFIVSVAYYLNLFGAFGAIRAARRGLTARATAFGILTVLGIAVAVFGTPVE